MHSPALRLCAGLLIALAIPIFADAPVPGSVLDPKTPSEAWNVIRLALGNVDRLISEKRFAEVPSQIAFCSPALRLLGGVKGSPEAKAISDRVTGWVVAVASACLEKNEARMANAMKTLRGQLNELSKFFEPKEVAADIFVCPMHPDVVSDDMKTPCAKCGMALLPRRIPYSFIYMTPGKPTIQLTATADGPIEAGRATTVNVRLARGDGSPVLPADLTVMHTQPIHLLIENRGLEDYHHEHPTRTGTPGEYAFSFTPKRNAPYRIWADIVPVATGLQELPFVDLPATGEGGAIEDKATRLTSAAGGLNFTLTIGGQSTATLRAQRTCGLEVAITDANGRPMKDLEPLMNAFAHLVGFYDDFKTVVHLHPNGGEILRDDARGGPQLLFTFFPPRPGFIRLYCQVQVNGKNLFAPFNINVQP